MGDVPVLKPREVAEILVALGFVQVRQRGSHCQYRHPDGRMTTVPFHQGETFRQLSFEPSRATSAWMSGTSSLASDERPQDPPSALAFTGERPSAASGAAPCWTAMLDGCDTDRLLPTSIQP